MTGPQTPEANARFARRSDKAGIEEGGRFEPLFDGDGLIPAIVSDSESGEVLMFAWMNAEALEASVATRTAHFYSRSRGRLWKKGEDSGNVLEIVEMKTDCDQDVVWLRVRITGDGVACHTKRRSCFYRTVDLDSPQGQPVGLNMVVAGAD